MSLRSDLLLLKVQVLLLCKYIWVLSESFEEDIPCTHEIVYLGIIILIKYLFCLISTLSVAPAFKLPCCVIRKQNQEIISPFESASEHCVPGNQRSSSSVKVVVTKTSPRERPQFQRLQLCTQNVDTGIG